jgi:lipoate-protein ligase A
LPSLPSPFDVEQFRTETRRRGVVRAVARPTVVLGSTQSDSLIDVEALRRGGVDLARRRGGGGAVFLAPGGQLWLDVWIPRHDPLWAVDVSVAAEWVGAWWAGALSVFGQRDLTVHAGRSEAGELGDLACFAGRGPGEVFDGDRKVVGLSQWRSRQGSLFSSCAYLRWDPTPLVTVLHPEGAGVPADLTRRLSAAAAGLADLVPPVPDLESVRAALEDSLADFGVAGSPGA